MAEGLLKRMIVEKWGEKSKDVEVISAGISAFSGSAASCQAVNVMLEEGINLSNHKARVLTLELLKECELILTMTQQHKQYIVQKFPMAADKVFVLKEYAENASYYAEKKEEIDVLTQKLSKKQINFFAIYHDEIEALRKKYDRLREELQQIQRDLTHYEERLANETYPERKELERLIGDSRNIDVMDPFGQPSTVYRQCFFELKEVLEKVIKKLEEQKN